MHILIGEKPLFILRVQQTQKTKNCLQVDNLIITSK